MNSLRTYLEDTWLSLSHTWSVLVIKIVWLKLIFHVVLTLID